MYNQKGIAPVAIIFIILFVIAGGIFVLRYLGEEEVKVPEETTASQKTEVQAEQEGVETSEQKSENEEITEEELTQIRIRDLGRHADLRQIEIALEMYYGFYNSYPVLIDTSQDGEFLKVLADEGYIGTFLDPQHPDHFYEYQGSVTSYILKSYAEEEGGQVDMYDGKKDRAYIKVVK